MSVEVLHDIKVDAGCFYDNTTDRVFGPVMDGPRDEIEMYLEVLINDVGIDPRTEDINFLEEGWADWKANIE